MLQAARNSGRCWRWKWFDSNEWIIPCWWCRWDVVLSLWIRLVSSSYRGVLRTCAHKNRTPAYRVVGSLPNRKFDDAHGNYYVSLSHAFMVFIEPITVRLHHSSFFPAVRAISNSQRQTQHTLDSGIMLSMFTGAHKSPAFIHADTFNWIITFYDYFHMPINSVMFAVVQILIYFWFLVRQ